MPHSSGGGSSGGGYHGGSSSGGHSGSSKVYSSRPFPGATCYVYYSHARPHLIYTNEANETRASGYIALIILFSCLFLFSIAFSFLSSYHHPSKLKTNYDTTIVIKDENNILDDEEETLLNNKFDEFLSTTGITPSLITTDISLYPSYSSLEDYAYDRYVNSFKDEKHWLIVYSSNQGTQKDNWAFEGMQGDDTDSILYSYVTDKFNKTLYTSLNDGSVSVTNALIRALDEITPNIMDKAFHLEVSTLIVGLAMAIMFGALLVLQIVAFYRSKQMKKAIKMTSTPSLKVCPYCGNSYYAETVDTCPKCGKDVEFPMHPHLPTDIDND